MTTIPEFKPVLLNRRSVGNIARSLYTFHDWDWDAAYAAAYAYKHNKLSPHSWQRAMANVFLSNHEFLSPTEIQLIEAAYRKVKTGS